MRALLAALTFCLLMFSLPASAEARTSRLSVEIQSGRAASQAYWRYRGHYVKRQRWSHHLRHHYRHVNVGAYRSASLPGPCRVAASMGGPCGCWAAYTLLGRLDHVWHGMNLWLADDWLKFPRTAPAPGTAAVWPHRHVAPVLAVNHDGTVTVRDSWATHRVRIAGLVFVQPPENNKRHENYNPKYNWPSAVPL